jgi:hypothetical protein
MAKPRRQLPFWRRQTPSHKYDIELLRPADRARGKSFETLADAQQESERSEQLLRSFSGGNKELAELLQECRAGDYECNRPFCPICARVFRRWLIGEVLRITKGDEPVRIYTILLEEAPQDEINDLDPTTVQHQLRKRLDRAGLGKVPVIGGIEIVYKARKRVWLLHANLVMIGGKKAAREAQAKADALDAAVFDLKAVNPNAVVKIDPRTPEEVIESIENQGEIVSKALTTLRTLLQA